MRLQLLHNNQWVCLACVWAAAEVAVATVEAVVDLVNLSKGKKGISHGSLFL
jgi:hypothetical protein